MERKKESGISVEPKILICTAMEKSTSETVYSGDTNPMVTPEVISDRRRKKIKCSQLHPAIDEHLTILLTIIVNDEDGSHIILL